MSTIKIRGLEKGDEAQIHASSSRAGIGIQVDRSRNEYIISILHPTGGRDLLEIVGFDGELGR